MLIQVAKDFRLDFELFSGSFNHEIAIRKLGTLKRRRDPLQRGCFVRSRDFAFGNFAVEILADGFERAIEKALFHIAQGHGDIRCARKRGRFRCPWCPLRSLPHDQSA